MQTLTNAQVEHLVAALTDDNLALIARTLTGQHVSNLPAARIGTIVTLLRQWYTGGGTADTLAPSKVAASKTHCQAEAKAS